MAGKLNGVMPAHDAERLAGTSTRSTPVETWAENSPLSSCGMPQANSTTSSPRCTSPAASRQHLAVLVGDGLGQPVDVGVDELAEREQHLGALAQRRLRPVGERLAGRGDRGVDIAGGGERDLCLLLAGGGVPHRPSVDRPFRRSRLPAIQCSIVLIAASFVGVCRCRVGAGGAGGGAVAPCARRTSSARPGCSSSAETSATGTSHQAGLSGAGTSGSVSTWTTVVRVDGLRLGEAPSRARRRRGADDVGRRGWRRSRRGRPAARRRRGRCRCGSGSGCRTAASPATPTARRSRRSRGSARARRSASRPPATAVTISCAIIR